MRIDAPEPDWQIRLRREEGEKLHVALEHLLPPEASAAYLISQNGQELAAVVRDDPADRLSLPSLAAGTLAAATGLGQALSRNGNCRFLLWGPDQSVLLAPVGRRALLLLVLRRGSQDRMADRRLDRSVRILEDILARLEAGGPAAGSTING